METCTSQKVIDNSIQNFSVLSETFILYQYFLNVRKKQLNSLLSNGLTTGAKAIEFIISILKSLVIPVIWLALSSVIYSRITLFVLNHLFSKSHHSCSKSHHFCFKSHQFWLYIICIISVSGTKWDLKAFLFLLFNKTATCSNKYWYRLNSAISKWL